MSQSDLARFRAMCGQFRWLAVFMVVTVGGLLALLHLIFPAMIAVRDGGPPPGWTSAVLFASPTVSTCSRSGRSVGRWGIWREDG